MAVVYVAMDEIAQRSAACYQRLSESDQRSPKQAINDMLPPEKKNVIR